MAPGLASSAADNDPSGIATYSLAGAQYGYDMLAAIVLSYPFLVALQLVSARIAAVTGRGLTGNLRKHESRPVLYFAVARFLLANLFNIVANIVAMGIGVRLLCRGPVVLWAVLATLLSIGLQWFVPYPRYARIVQWLATGLFLYAAVLLVVDTPWKLVALRSFMPRLTASKDSLEMLLAVLGTTVSPYLLFSQAEQEVEELHGRIEHCPAPEAAAIRERHLRKTRKNILIHTACSNGTAWFMLAATATTLHASGRPMLTLEDAALALDPVAGHFAGEALGLLLIGSALLALPLLAGSAANSAVSAFGGPHGEQRDRRIAQTLLALMAAGLLAAALLLVLHLDPVRILYWSAVFNGATVSPVIVLITMLSSKSLAAGEIRAHWTLRACSWLAAAAMSILVLAWLTSEIFS
ncbi:divalent metal cation transporter [Paraburkholderia sp. MMS20-SJTN17]|uniref:Divalent metal cation transporter n=1 Tax=Paraburkholderia translucens TaxID=2886945 RepID=A0ABS8KC09_9BURK|nr:divalent metal cation transporter [Paraburkholderia sp. MMS20-SJTN17]MCC8402305.1 divalent metal cation transporter [Paraburkholderia sp. MMS20-SJTN17]